jgi:glycosyltransferase involved in cell wall biosynthesis
MSLYREINRRRLLTFLVPHDKGLPLSDTVDGMTVHRFRYGSDKSETLAYRGDMHKQVFARPITAIRFVRSYLREAQRLAAEISPPVIWAQWWIPGGVVGERVAQRTDAPLVVSCHGTDIALLSRKSFLRPLASRVFRKARGITVVSSYLKDQVLDSLQERVSDLEDRIHIVSLPANTACFYHDKNSQRRPGTIVAATRYTAQKRNDILIRSVSRLRSEGVECQVDLFGEGPEFSNLRKMVVDFGLEDCFRLNQSVTHEQLAQKYRTGTISLLVSEREGFGLTLVEAMLCGCAVIGARSGGITDIIRTDGEEGLLVPLDDVEALSQALKRLLSDDALRLRLAETGRKAVERRFSVKTIVDTYVDILSASS